MQRDCLSVVIRRLPARFLCTTLTLLMLQTFTHLSQQLQKRFRVNQEVAQSRTSSSAMSRQVAERLFRDDFSQLDVQLSLYETLEARYIFPEAVMKVMHEVIASMEHHAQQGESYMNTYLDILASKTSPSVGAVLALCLHLIASFWPLSADQMDVPVSEHEVASVLKGLYPSESSLKVHLEELMNDVLISSRRHLSLRKVREHFAVAILNFKEPIVRRLAECMFAQAGSVHWADLDYDQFWEAFRAIGGEDSASRAMVGHYVRVRCEPTANNHTPAAESACVHRRRYRLDGERKVPSAWTVKKGVDCDFMYRQCLPLRCNTRPAFCGNVSKSWRPRGK